MVLVAFRAGRLQQAPGQTEAGVKAHILSDNTLETFPPNTIRGGTRRQCRQCAQTKLETESSGVPASRQVNGLACLSELCKGAAHTRQPGRTLFTQRDLATKSPTSGASQRKRLISILAPGKCHGTSNLACTRSRTASSAGIQNPQIRIMPEPTAGTMSCTQALALSVVVLPTQVCGMGYICLQMVTGNLSQVWRGSRLTVARMHACSKYAASPPGSPPGGAHVRASMQHRAGL